MGKIHEVEGVMVMSKEGKGVKDTHKLEASVKIFTINLSMFYILLKVSVCNHCAQCC
jgi:hypothetical protein